MSQMLRQLSLRVYPWEQSMRKVIFYEFYQFFLYIKLNCMEPCVLCWGIFSRYTHNSESPEFRGVHPHHNFFIISRKFCGINKSIRQTLTLGWTLEAQYLQLLTGGTYSYGVSDIIIVQPQRRFFVHQYPRKTVSTLNLSENSVPNSLIWRYIIWMVEF